MLRANQNLEPGIFVSKIPNVVENNVTKSYLDLYKNFGKKSHPFSWFILDRLTCDQHNGYGINEYSFPGSPLTNRIKITPSNPVPKLDLSDLNNPAFAHAIVSCNREAINTLLRELGDDEGNFTIHPARKIEMNFSFGED